MEEFTKLFSLLDQSNKTNDKLAILKEFFHKASDEDNIWTVYFLSGRTIKRFVNTSYLKLWAMELSGIPEWLFEESYHTVGDLAEAISLMLPTTDYINKQPLKHWISVIFSLRDSSEVERKQIILESWASMNQEQKFVFNKLLTGGFRIGVSQNLVVRAIAEAYDLEVPEVAHRLTGKWTPETTKFSYFTSKDTEKKSFQPYPFCLAYALDIPFEELGKPEEWQAEWKWDGMRSQIIYRNSEFFIWSRGDDLITEKFPELHDLAKVLPANTVIDAEILPYKNHPLLFGVLQTRIGRKNISSEILKTAPVILMAYDLLELDGKDLRQEPISKRRQLLEDLVKKVQKKFPEAPIMPSPIVNFSSWEDLRSQKDTARSQFAEGIMLKRLSSEYKTGRKRGEWWKWKVNPLSIDTVLVYAQKGHGRRANLYTDYTLAIWKDDQLVPIAKAYSGLNDAEINKVDSFIKRNTQDKFGPVRTVKPELVFEIGFEGIQESNRHKSGVALRFPRILRWRIDKKPEDADTYETVHAILKGLEKGEDVS